MSDTDETRSDPSRHGHTRGHYQTYELIDLNAPDRPVDQVVLMTAEEAIEQNQRLIDAGSDQQWRTIRAPRVRISDK